MNVHTVPHAVADELDTPSLVVDLDVLERNISRMAATMAGRGIALRPHFKTHKTLEIAHRQMAQGAVGQTCATLGEAEVLVDGGIHDVFVAFPVWPGGPKRARLRALHERAPALRLGVDSAEGACALGGAMHGAPSALQVLVEVDTGGRRTGCRPAEAGTIAAEAQRAGLDVVGVFTHGGHSYGIDGAAAGAARDEEDGLETAVESFRRHGVAAAVVSAGSTPTASFAPRGVITEERPGTYVLGDRQQVVIGSCREDEVALVVASTVVSTAAAGQVVLDAGTKALGREHQPWLTGFGHVVGAPEITIDRLYDHHGVAVLAPAAPRPAMGDVVGVVPNHVCPVVNLARELVVTRGATIVARWDVAARAVV